MTIAKDLKKSKDVELIIRWNEWKFSPPGRHKSSLFFVLEDILFILFPGA